MRNIRLNISFDGSMYHGYQTQKNGDTVQARLEKAVSELSGKTTIVTGCSRTDAGVHAREFIVNFKTESEIPCQNFRYALNCLLPGDIAVNEVTDVPETFHSRFDAVKKEYCYEILNTPVKNPFYRSYAFFYPRALDVSLMNEAAAFFVGTKDFKAFMAQGSTIRETVRTIFEAKTEQQGDIIRFTVSGDGFLYNMVRIMAGTLLYVSEGKLKKDDLPELIANGDRTQLGKTMPPQGLYLNRVFY